jgi:Mannosyltransferase (PIG-V)
MQDRRIAWKESAQVFLLSRVILLVITMITILSLELLQNSNAGIHVLYLSMLYSHDPAGRNIFLFSWYHWDAAHFVSISGRGYADSANTAFFPLWPLLQHIVGLLLGGKYPGSYYIAGLLLSNLCFYIVLVLLFELIAADFDDYTARRTLFYLSFAPYALFFFAGYTESLFLLLCVVTFLVLRRGGARGWWFAGILGFLASLTRSSGVALAIPYLVLYIRRFWVPSKRLKFSWKEKLNALSPIVLIPAGVVAYLVYLYFAKGDPFIFGAAEKYFWHRHYSPPWATLYLIWRAFFSATSSVHLWGESVAFVFTLIPLLILGFGWRRIPLHYALFSLVLAALSLSFPIETDSPLLSQPRYLLMLFPVAVIAALWGKNRRFHRVYPALSTGCFLTFTILFVCGLWVA